MNYKIRTAKKKDASALREIYGHYINEASVTLSTVNPSVEYYENQIEQTMKQSPFLVAEQKGRISGFAYGSNVHFHEAYRWNAELKVCLSPDAPKRMGIGSRLYREMLAILKKQGYKAVYGVVTAENNASIAFHLALGFTQTGYFEKAAYKNGKWYDIVCMRKEIGSYSDTVNAPVPFPNLWK